MSCSQEYPAILGERHPKIPKNTKARYILLPKCQLYQKIQKKEFCDKCDKEHEIYKWIHILPKSTIAFIDVKTDKVIVIDAPEQHHISSKSEFEFESEYKSGSISNSGSESSVSAKLTVTNIGKVDKNTETLIYNITIANDSTHSAENVDVIGLLPDVRSNWSVVHHNDKCKINRNNLRCLFETIGPHQSKIIKVFASIRTLRHLRVPPKEVFSNIKINASNAAPINIETITIIPCD